MFDLDLLKRELKDLVGLSQHDEVFRRLKEDILQDGELYNDTVIIQSRYSDSRRASNLGTIDFREKNLHFNNISQALVWIIDSLAPVHIKTEFQRKTAQQRSVPGYHAYTCDRVEQTDAFERFRTHIRPGSSQFFYLFGGELQAHKSFFARIAHELAGSYHNDETPAATHKQRAVQITFTVEECRDPQVLRERFVRNLFTAFGLVPDDFRPLLQQNLSILLENSEKTKTLTAKDYLCVFVHISHWAWNKNLTPEAAHWFVQTFCQCAVRADGPALLFFFAFDYDEDMNPGVRDEVMEALKRGSDVAELPELGMVQRKDVANWMVRYHFLFRSTDDRRKILMTRFADEEYFMEDVELELQRLIDAGYG